MAVVRIDTLQLLIHREINLLLLSTIRMYVHTDIRHLVGLQPEQLLLHQGGDAKVE